MTNPADKREPVIQRSKENLVVGPEVATEVLR
ncbi:MAG: hypothetical protein QOF33_1995 [Thermomicrobiales bacterium]|jgi:hypothetical protein|nr:hypothetical protein [Thermomicrobiales bacterium]MEA2522940.1 hypothetical protein [Thermomicrobiales bacterium]MEA2583910.1 hypothetical protein [Thermomicrobiales bacterium]MEA2597507.1 hypothetical protein [Thermomicrobiales bacterium]